MKLVVDSHNFESWLQSGAPCRGVVFQALDLRAQDAELAGRPQAAQPGDSCLTLGCELGPKFAVALAANYGVIFPILPGRPYQSYRTSLYTVDELFAGYDPDRPSSYLTTPDWLTYRSFIKLDENNVPLRPTQYVDAGADEVIARRLHDHFIEAETEEFLSQYRVPHGRGIVAIMGGHDTPRSHPTYRQIAEMARMLTRLGFLVASGGGPGLMEAANFGAYFAPHDDAELPRALALLSRAERFNDPNWLSTAWQVRQTFSSPDPIRSRSFGVPTWFYGHEPPNVFSSHIAKYFENSLREEGLLAIGSHGIIFGEGNGGTVQEIFQDACQNYYSSYQFPSPMILFGSEFWNPTPDAQGEYPGRSKPAWPLLRKLARDGRFEPMIVLTSDPEVVLDQVTKFRAPGQEN
jgi:predicted Rossmann-fold nucleotide-binding protein